MQDKETRIEAAKESINRLRRTAGKPEVEEIAIIENHNGLVVMPIEDFMKLSKQKQKKLMKW